MNDKELSSWIEYLISINRLDKFYHSKYFKRVKKEVLKEQHYECQECKKVGKLTIVKETIKRSGVVHHVKYVRDYPSLALSKYYVDELGHKQQQLVVLCNPCHELVHERYVKKVPSFLNDERW